MYQAKDSLLKQLALLGLTPCEPQRVANITFLKKFATHNFCITQRPPQHDLNKLSGMFDPQCDNNVTPARWSFSCGARLDLTATGTPTIRSLRPVLGHPRNLLPKSAPKSVDYSTKPRLVRNIVQCHYKIVRGNPCTSDNQGRL